MARGEQILACLLAMFGFTTPSCLFRDQDNPTTDPPTDPLQQLAAVKGEFLPTFVLYPKLKDSVQTLDKFSQSYPHMVNISYSSTTNPTKIQELSCADPPRMAPVVNRFREPCPVEYVLNYDPNRVPDRLLDARCRCSNVCIGLTTGGQTWWGCHPTEYFTRVMRKRSTGDKPVYEEVWEPVTVACACRGFIGHEVNGTYDRIFSTNPGSLPRPRRQINQESQLRADQQ